MKKLSLLPLALVAFGCHHSEFDISPAQVRNRQIKMGGGPGGFDISKLPPGAVKHEKIYHKGDKLPDGTISPGERKMVTVEVKGTGSKSDMVIQRTGRP
jgi:hypothetical protein